MSTTWEKRSDSRWTQALWSSATLPWQLDLPWQWVYFVISEWEKRPQV